MVLISFLLISFEKFPSAFSPRAHRLDKNWTKVKVVRFNFFEFSQTFAASPALLIVDAIARLVVSALVKPKINDFPHFHGINVSHQATLVIGPVCSRSERKQPVDKALFNKSLIAFYVLAFCHHYSYSIF